MEKTIINPTGNWDFRNEEYLNNLEKGKTIYQVRQKVVFENNEIQIWRFHLEPGQHLPFHTHKLKYYWYCLSEGKTQSYYSDERVEEITYSIDDASYLKKTTCTHNIENIGNTTLIFSTVEFLD